MNWAGASSLVIAVGLAVSFVIYVCEAVKPGKCRDEVFVIPNGMASTEKCPEGAKSNVTQMEAKTWHDDGKVIIHCTCEAPK